MSDYNNIAQQFVGFYYNTFDTNRGGLSNLYRDDSMLTFETASNLGAASITEKLTSLPFSQVQHQLATLDAQPSPDGSIIVLVTGALKVDDQPQPMNYTQTFVLKPDGAGSYYVHHDIFRIIYPA
ncbi:nuclear transport factor 2 [Penicillium taxi]|uniref:nuclear transport factor 2 n=1 Tax=Penicillium taxi TaxID=168475 RepID=UPI002545B7B3|nr:nuclear transport factor 2 [Penicillium taxi]KAJ5888084.1 nuclear transport factor 2 [Penicillium taxi]